MKTNLRYSFLILLNALINAVFCLSILDYCENKRYFQLVHYDASKGGYMDFIHFLLTFHVGFGELAGLCFLWVAIDTFNRTDKGLARIKIFTIIGTVAAFAAWFVGGYYYVVHYGTKVKPVIIAEASKYKWAHQIVIEFKEHIFLFIPVLAVAVLLFFWKTSKWSDVDSATTNKIGFLSLLIFIMAFMMAGLGAIVSGVARTLLGGGI
jgi:hypothetical protein